MPSYQSFKDAEEACEDLRAEIIAIMGVGTDVMQNGNLEGEWGGHRLIVSVVPWTEQAAGALDVEYYTSHILGKPNA